jgi:hypothetical protein
MTVTSSRRTRPVWSDEEVLLGGAVLGCAALLLAPVAPLATIGSLLHELSHAWVARLSGTTVHSLVINLHGRGLASIGSLGSPTRGAVVLSAGYLGPPLAGAALIALSRTRERARAGLLGVAAVIAASLALWVRPDVGPLDPIYARMTATSSRDGMGTLIVGVFWVAGIALAAYMSAPREQKVALVAGAYLAAHALALGPATIGSGAAVGHSDAGLAALRLGVPIGVVLGVWVAVVVAALAGAVAIRFSPT